jgi:hypothetical protein
MPAPLVPNTLWAFIEPLILSDRPKPKGGHPRVSDRAALTGPVFDLPTGILWEMQPEAASTGCCSTG